MIVSPLPNLMPSEFRMKWKHSRSLIPSRAQSEGGLSFLFRIMQSKVLQTIRPRTNECMKESSEVFLLRSFRIAVYGMAACSRQIGHAQKAGMIPLCRILPDNFLLTKIDFSTRKKIYISKTPLFPKNGLLNLDLVVPHLPGEGC